MTTCERCGTSIEQVHQYDGKSYGSTCIKIVLKENGIDGNKIGPACFDQGQVLSYAAILDNGWPSWEIRKEMKSSLGSIGFNILNSIVNHHSIRLSGDAIQIYSKFKEWIN